MQIIKHIVQAVIAIGIFNVWLMRFGKRTTWRGGSATNMKEEFEAYGLPGGALYFVGFLKLLCASLLLVGIWVSPVTLPAACVIALLMLGAVAMHFKIGDSPKKSLPAASLLALSLLVLIL